MGFVGRNAKDSRVGWLVAILCSLAATSSCSEESLGLDSGKSAHDVHVIRGTFTEAEEYEKFLQKFAARRGLLPDQFCPKNNQSFDQIFYALDSEKSSILAAMGVSSELKAIVKNFLSEFIQRNWGIGTGLADCWSSPTQRLDGDTREKVSGLVAANLDSLLRVAGFCSLPSTRSGTPLFETVVNEFFPGKPFVLQSSEQALRFYSECYPHCRAQLERPQDGEMVVRDIFFFPTFGQQALTCRQSSPCTMQNQ